MKITKNKLKAPNAKRDIIYLLCVVNVNECIGGNNMRMAIRHHIAVHWHTMLNVILRIRYLIEKWITKSPKCKQYLFFFFAVFFLFLLTFHWWDNAISMNSVKYYSVYGHFFFITIDRSFDESNFESEIELIYRTAYWNQSHSTENERVDRFGFFFVILKRHVHISIPLRYHMTRNLNNICIQSQRCNNNCIIWLEVMPTRAILSSSSSTHSIRGGFPVGRCRFDIFLSFRNLNNQKLANQLVGPMTIVIEPMLH